MFFHDTMFRSLPSLLSFRCRMRLLGEMNEVSSTSSADVRAQRGRGLRSFSLSIFPSKVLAPRNAYMGVTLLEAPHIAQILARVRGQR